jgi:hypothetical protein
MPSCPACLPNVIRRGVHYPAKVFFFSLPFSQDRSLRNELLQSDIMCAGKDVMSPAPPVAQPYTRLVWLLEQGGLHRWARQKQDLSGGLAKLKHAQV